MKVEVFQEKKKWRWRVKDGDKTIETPKGEYDTEADARWVAENYLANLRAQ